MREGYLFAGPSLTERAQKAAKRRSISILPPVLRGDVAALVSVRPPSTLVIADGRFHDVMSVGHAELREALSRGWDVWGVASMGAIRAYEMRELGMRGYGRIYGMFVRLRDFQDDEVALLHGPKPPYEAASEPLVHLRVALRALLKDGLIERRAATRIARSLKRLWYGERTLALFEHLVVENAKSKHRAKILSMLSNFDRFRIKQQDLAEFLSTRPVSCVHGKSPVRA